MKAIWWEKDDKKRYEGKLFGLTEYFVDKNTLIASLPPKGRFKVSWVPTQQLQNRVVLKNGIKYPGNEHMGAFGCDSYDISGTVDIDVSFKFRPFRPMVIESNIPELLSNLSVFEIASIHTQIEVLE